MVLNGSPVGARDGRKTGDGARSGGSVRPGRCLMRAWFGVEAELETLERMLLEAVRAREPLLEEMARYVISAGGKRIRPLAALLAFRVVGGPEERLADCLEMCTGLELIHTATLVHDDINDGARMRRGRPSCHVKYGAANALIVGDFLFTKGFQISGRFDRTIVDWTGEACQELAEGEVMQGRYLNDPSLTVEDYLRLVEKKTASVVRTGIRIGAYLGGADPETLDALSHYGRDLGIAFQIIDDVLDVAGEDAKTGKRTGIDIRHGTPTLPSILTLQSGVRGASELQSIMRTPSRDSEAVETALQIIRESGAVDEARRLAAEHGARAREAAQVVKDPEGREKLTRLVDVILQREL
jgi:geranylgeranyl pyrophosphate synthase